MNVVTVSEDCYPDVGGIATHVQGLSAALVRAGVRVAIVTRRRDVPAMRNVRHWRARHLVHEGVGITAIPVMYSPRNALRPLQFSTRFAFAAALRLIREADRVLTFHHFLYDPDAVRPLHRLTPIVFTNHSSQFLAAMSHPTAERAALLRRFAFADRVIAPSRELVTATVACGYPAERTHYIPNGVDVERFRPNPEARAELCRELELPPDTPLVLCARTPVEKNGVIYFIEALARLAARDVRLSVVFAGMTPEARTDEYGYTSQCREAALALPSQIAVRIVGAVANEHMPRLHAAADCSVLPSLVEATSISGLESLACGTPVVGTAVGGIPEIVRDGVTGILVPPRDPDAFADALERMLGEPALAHRMGAESRSVVEREFSWDRIARLTVDVYRESQRDRQRSSFGSGPPNRGLSAA